MQKRYNTNHESVMNRTRSCHIKEVTSAKYYGGEKKNYNNNYYFLS